MSINNSVTKYNFNFLYLNTKTESNGGVLSSLFIETNIDVFSVLHIPSEYHLQLAQRKPCIT